jgi:hypothetical protein
MGTITMTNRDYVGFVGIKHDNVSFNNTMYCEFHDGAITNTTNGFIFNNSSGSDYNLIRGYVDDSLSSEGNIHSVSGNYNRIEYIKVPTEGGDFVRLFGHHNIVRNSYLGPKTEYVSNHKDDAQSYEQTSGNPNHTSSNLIEGLFSYGNNTQNSHGWIFQDTSGTVTLGGGIFRGNVMSTYYENIAEFNNWPDVFGSHNTCVDLWEGGQTWPDLTIWIRGTSTDHEWGNNTFTNGTYNNQGEPFQVQSPATATFFNNHEHLSGSPSGDGWVTGDPLFNDYASQDFSMNTGSPLEDAARYLTQANGSGSSSSSLTVDEAGWFMDGWGIVQGDKIRIGSNAAVEITNISGSVLTLASAQTWSDNDGIFYATYYDDIGALPYRSGGFTVSGNWSASGNNHTANMDNDDLVRMVVFYENGIPQSPDYDSPYEYTGSGGTITANIYARFASQIPVVAATAGGGPSGDGDMTIGGDLTVDSLSFGN